MSKAFANRPAWMLDKLAAEANASTDEGTRPIGCIVLVLNEAGQWAADMVGVGPFGAVAMLEFAKTDLIVGGLSWTDYDKAPEPVVQPELQLVK